MELWKTGDWSHIVPLQYFLTKVNPIRSTKIELLTWLLMVCLFLPLYKLFESYLSSLELAHQWFGNLVTMDWWSELWLNEGFATWVGWLAVDHFYPGTARVSTS
jgi:Peptidase family M1 domain